MSEQADRDAPSDLLAAHAIETFSRDGVTCSCRPNPPHRLVLTWTDYRAHLADVLAQRDRRVAAEAWSQGHAAGRDYAGDGWNSDAHDPEADNPYREARP